MPDTSVIRPLKWDRVKRHFRERAQVSRELLTLHADGKEKEFATLAIGVTNPAGNYSAAEHPVLQLGITSENRDWERKVVRLAAEFKMLRDASGVPELITNAGLKFLQISVGSEMSCMVNPTVCWVCNVRTIWLHLAWTEGTGTAEKLLALYRSGASESEMAYVRWADVYHPLLRQTLIQVAQDGYRLAGEQSTSSDDGVFLWADAIASFAYGQYHGERE